MVQIAPDDHGIVASISNLLRSTDPIDEQIMDLHDEITTLVDIIEEETETLGRKLEAAKTRWNQKIEREEDVDSVHDFDKSQKPWLELENVLHNWKLLREGIPDWQESYSERDISLATSEEDMYGVSEQLESYKAGLEDLKAELNTIERGIGELLRATQPGKGNMSLAAAQARMDLNDQITKMVELEKAANTIESETLDESRALAKKIINGYETIRDPSFNDADRFEYFVLDPDDDFNLLSYWIFHDEIDRVTLKPRNKTRYRVHTDSSLPIPHVNLCFEDRDGNHLIHVIPASEASAWEDLLSSQSSL
jgi:hypothetical protein